VNARERGGARARADASDASDAKASAKDDVDCSAKKRGWRGNRDDGDVDDRADEDARERAVTRERALRAALRRVDAFGFTADAVDAGLRDLKLSPAFRGVCVRGDGENGASAEALGGELAAYFEEACDGAFHAKIVESAETLSKMSASERMKWLIRTRLEFVIPRLEAWPRALATMAHPVNALATLRRRASLADDIAQAVDASPVDVLPAELDGARWYAERATIAALYSATELRLATDSSPNFADVWTFLDARVDELSSARTSALEMKSYLDVIARSSNAPLTVDAVASTFLAAARSPFAALARRFPPSSSST